MRRKLPAISRAVEGFVRPRDFGNLWAGSALGHVGHQLTGIALPVLAVNMLAASEWEMGILAAAFSAAFLIIGLPTGAWVDRMSKRRVLVVSELIRGIVLALAVLAVLGGYGSMPLLFGAAFILGCATVFFDVAHQSFVPALTGLTHVVEGNLRLQATESVAAVAGPAVGGQLLRVISAPLVIAVNAVLYFASAIFLTRISLEEKPEPTERNLRQDIAEGAQFVFRHRLLRKITMAAALSNLAWGIVGALEAIYILRYLDLSEAVMGMMFSIGAIGGLVGALASGPLTRVVGKTRIIPLTAIALTVPTALFPLAVLAPRPQIILTIGMFFIFGIIVIFNIAAVSYRQQLCPPKLLGRMNATVRFVVWGITPFGGLLGGFLGEKIGIVPSLWVAVIGTALSSLPLVFSTLWSSEQPAADSSAAPGSA